MNQIIPLFEKKYPVLERLIFERGIKKKDIAKALNITPRGLSLKLSGKRRFLWDEVCIMQEQFFTDVDKDELLKEGRPK
ncbi:MAG: hypothetical protein KH056_01915 [Clostridiales bacterium]|nr:hypothetical protein [Clostridiales bacterium]DAV20442.1 MAG TPA: SOS-response transcriptional repressor [Caudoviricetes sp.]